MQHSYTDSVLSAYNILSLIQNEKDSRSFPFASFVLPRDGAQSGISYETLWYSPKQY